jgi:galactitol-specific phosphotransferase system IIC component
MTQPTLKDKTYATIMKHFVATGQAPHYTQIAKELGISPEEGQKALHDLFSTTGFAGWLFPKTDSIVSFAPFNNLPTHYRLTIDGQQKWFGQ